MPNSSDETIKDTLSYFEQAIAENKDNPGPVLFEMCQFLFQNSFYEEALRQLVTCHRLSYRTGEIQNIIMEAYYEPNIQEFKSKYERNVSLLSGYQYIKQKDFPGFSELRYCFVPYSDKKFIIFDKETGEFGTDFDLLSKAQNLDTLNHQSILLIADEFDLETITQYELKTRDSGIVKIPLHLYYHDFDKFVQYLQVVDFTELVETNRLVFLFGEQEFNDWFAHPQSISPTNIISTHGVEKIKKQLGEIIQIKNDDISAAMQKNV